MGAVCRNQLTMNSRHILTASRQLVLLDEKQVDAVSARIELDLRIGYAFTRWLTLSLRQLGGVLKDKMISYGMFPFTTPLLSPDDSL